jgi:hypothetical protein
MHIQSVVFAIAAILLIGLGVWLKPHPKEGPVDRARLARLLLAELELSHKILVRQARSTGSIPELLRTEMSRARQIYMDHFGNDDPTGETFEQAASHWLRTRPSNAPSP